MKTFLLLIASAATLLAGQLRAETVYDLAIVDASIVDVQTGEVSVNRTILLEGDRIAAIVPSDSNFSSRQQFRATGRYVIPGLWDMHIHIRGGDELIAANAAWLPQYLSHGVTAVRDGGGDLPDVVARWRDEIDRGERIGPRIYTSLQKIDGPGSSWPGSIEISSVEEVGAALDNLESRNADFIKLYDSTISHEVYLATLEEAERRGLRTSGHLPMAVTIEQAIGAGIDAIEHEVYLARAASTRDHGFARRAAEGEPLSVYGLANELIDSADDQHRDRQFAMMKANNVAIVSTILFGRMLDRETDWTVFEQSEGLTNTPERMRETFAERVAGAQARTPQQIATDTLLSGHNRRLLADAVERGVTVLAGTDTGAVNSFLFPGDSLHRELEDLVAIGVTPLQALRSTTTEAAAWLDESEDYGTLEVGKVADFVVLQSNPLENISNTRAIEAVVQNGRLFTRGELQDLRELNQ
ncbi:amidohydrolase family protein [Erythrobacter sp. NFXS35]|uniref:amidohydrolase family protein n=1 Tax=Erythrobacter sp. NFXS35 TaxID=2818436 RepID=UPI0032DEF3BC